MVTMQDPKAPKCQPLKSFRELLDWQPGRDSFNVANTPFHTRPTCPLQPQVNLPTQSFTKTLPVSPSKGTSLKDCKVIVCHDMAGGYIEDLSPQGNDYSTIYSIQYWNHVDIFIYFSHHRISMPPPGWTNAAHRNGVRCLGTIITEWLPGILETDEMVAGPGQSLTADDDKIDRRWYSQTYADKLVDMAVYYKFDGWFINIESILRGGAEQANQMIAFLAYLRAQIHARIPGGQLIWYDSVITSTGEVAWQDKLSLENYRFFEQTDGIFTNYTWKENAVQESAALAGPRNRDVYTGIDIWGRNTFGGGGYSTHKALDVIQREGTSCALFATAWTYESLGKENFMANDRLFWTGIGGAGSHAESLRTAHPPEKEGTGTGTLLLDPQTFLPVSAYIPARPSGCSSWFYTNFDRGFGQGFWVDGKNVSCKPWSHLSQQSLPPCMTKKVLNLGQDFAILGQSSAVRWILSPEDAYQGGTSLLIERLLPDVHKAAQDTGNMSMQGSAPSSSSDNPPTSSILVPLYDTHISLWSAQNSTVELVYKRCQKNVQVGIHLGMLAIEMVEDRKCRHFESLDDPRRSTLPPGIAVTQQSLGSVTISDGSEEPIVTGERPQERLMALVTLDRPENEFGVKKVEEGLIQAPLMQKWGAEIDGYLYSIETLEGGWERLALHLSSLLDLHGLKTQDENQSELSTVVLSQLGVTLSYEEQDTPWTELGTCPMVTLGSLAVIPTWSTHHKGSITQGLEGKDVRLDVIQKRADVSRLGVETTVEEQSRPWLVLSCTLFWNIGHPIVGPGLTLLDNNCRGQSVSTSEYSHFCIYISMEPRQSGTTDVPGQGGMQFVGTAFTNQYRLSNVEVPLDGDWGHLESVSGLSLWTGHEGKVPWIWVQGIRRDGRADSRQEWAAWQMR